MNVSAAVVHGRKVTELVLSVLLPALKAACSRGVGWGGRSAPEQKRGITLHLGGVGVAYSRGAI